MQYARGRGFLHELTGAQIQSRAAIQKAVQAEAFTHSASQLNPDSEAGLWVAATLRRSKVQAAFPLSENSATTASLQPIGNEASRNRNFWI